MQQMTLTNKVKFRSATNPVLGSADLHWPAESEPAF